MWIRTLSILLLVLAPWCVAEELTAEVTEHISKTVERVWKGEVIAISIVETHLDSGQAKKELEVIVYTHDFGHDAFRMQFVDEEWQFSQKQLSDVRMKEETLSILREMAEGEH